MAQPNAHPRIRLSLLSFALVQLAGCSEPQAGGQSGSEGHTNRPPFSGDGASCAAPPASDREFDPEDSVRLVSGRHELTLAWQPTDPFTDTQARSTRVVVDVETHGDIYPNFECGFAQIETSVTLELADGQKAAFDGATFLHKGYGLVTVESDRPIGRSLSIPGAALSHDTNGHHRLAITFKADAAANGFIASWTDHGEGQCMRATLPADGRACEWSGLEVDWDTRIGDFALEDALARIQNIGIQPLAAAHDVESTDVELTIEKREGPVCLSDAPYFLGGDLSGGADAGPLWRKRLTAPVMVRARTTDGSLDATLPVTLQAIASEGAGWELIPGSGSAAGIDSRVDISGTAFTASQWVSPNPDAESHLVVVRLKASVGDDRARGVFTASVLDRASGWPAIKLPKEPTLRPIVELECTGLREGAVMLGGYFGEAEAASSN